MIGMIRPLVQEAKTPGECFIPFGLYLLGTLLSSTFSGAFLGALGSAILADQWLRPMLIAVAILGMGMAGCDLGIAGTHTPTLRRQTCQIWWHVIGQRGAIFLWGCDLGLGWTTIRITSLYWLVLLLVFTLASPVSGSMVLSMYGLALGLNLAVGIFCIQEKSERDVASAQVIRLTAVFQKSLAVVQIVWCLLLLFLIYKG